ncbi:MAG TPA: calcium-binding protein [Rhizomicrobium sp.]|nr:calcium-binding protein [Rhizomicrobium sp.]
MAIFGTSGNDTLTGTSGDDVFNLTQGGNDTVSGLGGDDIFNFGATFGAGDHVDGGAGNDTLKLDGPYDGAGALTIASSEIVSVEKLLVLGGGTNTITMGAGTVMAGQTFSVGDQTDSVSSHGLTFDFSADTGALLDYTGGSGYDFVRMGANLGASDRIDGGGGPDEIFLDGDYSQGLAFKPGTISNIGTIELAAGHSYKLTTADANVAAGASMGVDASALGASDTLNFNGSHETDGYISMTGGAGNDVLVGGQAGGSFNLSRGGEDTVRGSATADDSFLMGGSFDSGDRINGAGGNDGIDLNGDYSAGLLLKPAMMQDIRVLSVEAGHSYNLTVAATTFSGFYSNEIDGSSLGSGDTLIFNGSRVTNAGVRMLIFGGAGNDTLTGGAGSDSFSTTGGTDVIQGKGGNDTVFLASAAETSRIDGGDGNDLVFLTGDFSGGCTFKGNQLISVETLKLFNDAVYSLTMNDGNVAAGATMTVDASSHTAANGVTVNARQETDGSYAFLGGAGDDSFTGGQHANSFTGGAGQDTLTAGMGADTFIYNAVGESTSVGFDIVKGFDAAHDTFDLAGTPVTGIDAAVAGGPLYAPHFDANLAAAIGAGQLQAGHAVLFTPSAGYLAGHTLLVVDANGTAGYQAGADYVIDVTGLTGTLSTANFTH